MRLLRIVFVLVIVIGALSSSQAARGIWKPGDWASWSSFRYLTSATGDFKYLYFGTTGGILRVNRFTRNFEPPWTVSDGLPDNWVRGLYYDPEEDALVCNTQAGTAEYNLTLDRWQTGGVFQPELQSPNLSLDAYRNFFLDFGYSFEPGASSIQDIYLRQFPVTFAYQEDPQNIWLGTWGLGLALGNTTTGHMNFLKYGLCDKNVRSIYRDGDILYLAGMGQGTASLGITLYDLKKESWEWWEPISGFNLPSADVNVMAGDNTSIWLGTKSGLVRYTKKTERFQTFTRARGLWENEVTALDIFGGRLWIGTSRGVNVFVPGPDSLVKVELPDLKNPYVRAIKADSQGVWVGTEEGAYFLDLKEKTQEKFQDPYGLTNTRINDIASFGNQIWFATQRGILGYDTQTKKFTSYSQGVVTPGGDILQIQILPNCIWAATSNGAVKLDRTTGVWHWYTTFDGLVDNYVSSLLVDGSYVWLGTPEGLSRFLWLVPGRIE